MRLEVPDGECISLGPLTSGSLFGVACANPRQVTYSPVMGDYLTYKRNRAFDSDGVYPDENYAREIMQLLLSPGDFTWDVLGGLRYPRTERQPRETAAVGPPTGWTIDVPKSTAFAVSTCVLMQVLYRSRWEPSPQNPIFP